MHFIGAGNHISVKLLFAILLYIFNLFLLSGYMKSNMD